MEYIKKFSVLQFFFIFKTRYYQLNYILSHGLFNIYGSYPVL